MDECKPGDSIPKRLSGAAFAPYETRCPECGKRFAVCDLAQAGKVLCLSCHIIESPSVRLQRHLARNA